MDINIPDILIRAGEFAMIMGTAIWSGWQQWLHKQHEKRLAKLETTPLK